TGPQNEGLSVTIRDAGTRQTIAELRPAPVRTSWWVWAPKLSIAPDSQIDIVAEDNGRGWGQWQAVAWPHSTVSAATCFLDYIGDVFNPAARNAIQVVAHKDVTFSGWAIDEPNRALASSVDVVIDGQPHRAQYGADRPDVAEYFKNPAYLK